MMCGNLPAPDGSLLLQLDPVSIEAGFFYLSGPQIPELFGVFTKKLSKSDICCIYRKEVVDIVCVWGLRTKRKLNKKENAMTINMSYCRFQNTLLAVRECAGDLGEMIEGQGAPFSRSERKACIELAEEMIEFLRMLDEASGVGLSDDEDIRVGDLDCSTGRIELAVDSICEMAAIDDESGDDEDDDGGLGCR
jgi:hypothetical protein